MAVQRGQYYKEAGQTCVKIHEFVRTPVLPRLPLFIQIFYFYSNLMRELWRQSHETYDSRQDVAGEVVWAENAWTFGRLGVWRLGHACGCCLPSTCFSMALRDCKNTTGGCIPQIHMDARYLPLVRRGSRLDGQASRSSFAERRARGETHIDLWIDGALYPEDPATKRTPCFNTLKQFLQFLCHGEDGLLGYTKRLRDIVPPSGSVDRIQSTTSLENCVISLEKELARHEQDSIRLRQQRDQFQVEARVMATSAAFEVLERQRLQIEVARLETMCVQLKAIVAENSLSIATLTEQRQKLVVTEDELVVSRAMYSKLEEKFRRMVETPAGLRQRVHGRIMKNITDLRSGTGYFKRRTIQLRYQILPEVLHRVQQSNKRLGKKKRLGGEQTSQYKTAAVIASMLSRGEAKALAEQPQMSQATMAVAQTIFKKVQDVLTKEVMLGTVDGSSVTHRGYTGIYKTLKNRIGMVAPELQGSVLPSPSRLAELRKQMNENLPQFIGDYYHIEGRRHIPEVRQGKKVVRPAKEVTLHSKNNLFAELEVVQRSMVLFYDMTVEGSFQWDLGREHAHALRSSAFPFYGACVN